MLIFTLLSSMTTPLGPAQELATELGSNTEVVAIRQFMSWGLPTVPFTGTAKILEIKSVNKEKTWMNIWILK